MGKDPKLPNFQVSFAPHADAMVSLQPVADAIKGANSSVLFAIMRASAAAAAPSPPGHPGAAET